MSAEIGATAGGTASRIAAAAEPRPGGGPARWRSVAAALLLATFLPLLARATAARGQVPPDASWRTFETEHFRVTHAEGLGALARRAARVAEEAHAALGEAFVEPPGGEIELVVADNSDIPNGLTTLFPEKQVTLYVQPPVGLLSLTRYDDWLEVLITHELVHVYHLDEGGRLGSALRSVFGRVPAGWPFFPGFTTPGWTIEGLATYYESAVTGSGRIYGSFHEMVIRTAILEGRFEGIGEASGVSPVWPGPTRPYIYGGHFFRHLAVTRGEEGMGRFVEELSDRLLPFRLDDAAEEAFGVSFSRAWREWRDSLRLRYEALRDTLAARAPLTAGEPLTRRGRYAYFPRHSPDGRRIAFARSDGRSDIQLRVIDASGAGSRKWARLNELEAATWVGPGALVSAQVERSDPYHLYKDLFRSDGDGEEWITGGARVHQPDAHPRDGTLVAVQNGEGTNRLVRVDPPAGRVEPITTFRRERYWAFPRWSPDGGRIAVSRWTEGGFHDVVILRPDGSLLRRVTRDRAVDLAPAWSPDGEWLVWSSDRSGIPNLYATPSEGGPLRQVTNVLGGAHFPDVSPDGASLVYSGYHADGWRIERIPWDPASWFDPFPVDPSVLRAPGERLRTPAETGGGGDPSSDADPGSGEPPSGGPPPEDGAPPPVDDSGPYRPLRHLFPRYWAPLYREGETILGRDAVGTGYGAFTGGRDLVGRHRYTLWGTLGPDDGRFRGSLDYEYRGLGNPVLGVGLDQRHDGRGWVAVSVEGRPEPDTLLVVERERRAELSATLLRPRARSSGSLTFSVGLVREERELLELDLEETERRLTTPGGDPLRLDRTLGELSLTGAWANPRLHPYSISAEDGVSAVARIRRREDLDVPRGSEGQPEGILRGEGSYTEAVARGAGYLSFPWPGFADHVLALRASAGWADGPGADAFHFDLGGASGSSEALSGFRVPGGEPLLFPLRGYSRSVRTGSRIWSASLEYRLPLLLVHRGAGLRPAYLDRISGSVFVDAGDARGPREEPVPGFQGGPLLVSAGAEVTARILPLWSGVLDVRAGVAVPLREARGGRDPSVYVRLGRSF